MNNWPVILESKSAEKVAISKIQIFLFEKKKNHCFAVRNQKKTEFLNKTGSVKVNYFEDYLLQ